MPVSGVSTDPGLSPDLIPGQPTLHTSSQEAEAMKLARSSGNYLLGTRRGGNVRRGNKKSEIRDNWAECWPYLRPHLLMIVLEFHTSSLSALMIRPLRRPRLAQQHFLPRLKAPAPGICFQTGQCQTLSDRGAGVTHVTQL